MEVISMVKNIENIAESNDEMLTYFNKLYSDHEMKLQEYKALLFDTNVKLDELNRTKNVYSLNTDSRRDVFSPIHTHNTENEKEAELKDEIASLVDSRIEYEDKIDEETIYLRTINKKIKKLNDAKNAINELSKLNDNESSELENALEKQKDLEYQLEEERRKYKQELEERKKEADYISNESFERHMNNILRIYAFDEAYYSTVLEKRIRNQIIKNNRNLEYACQLIATDPGRAANLINDTVLNQNKISVIVEEQINRINHSSYDEKRPLKEILEEYLREEKNNHPQYKIEYSFGNLGHKANYIKQVYLKKLLDIFFDNIYKHSEAKTIKLIVQQDDGTLDVRISDDGIGITPDYLTDSEWYSGIHRAKEILFQLSGKLYISSNNGTHIRFNFKYI